MKHLRLFIALASVLLVPACGGGSGGGGGGAAAPGPKNLVYPQDVIVLLTGVDISGLVPSVNGNVGNWSITPALPSGVTLNAGNGALVGTPTALSLSTSYTITASNTNGSTATEIELSVARPSGFLVAANKDDDTLTSYTVDPETGRLFTQGYVDTNANAPEGVWRHPTLDVLYVPHLGPGNGQLSVFTLNRATAEPIYLVSRPLENGPHHVALASDGATLYVAASGADSLAAFSLDPVSGVPTLVGAPVATGSDPDLVALDPQGRFALVANAGDNSISIYSLDPVTGAPTSSGPTFSLNGAVPTGLAFSPSGNHVFVTAANFGLLLALAVDPVTGDLDVVNAVPTGPTPVDVAVHPDGRSVAVVQAGDETVRTWAVDPVTGVLGAAGSALASGANPQRVAYDEAGVLAYVANADSNDVSVFTVLPGSGTLADGGRFRAREGPSGVAIIASDLPVQPVADNLYVVNSGDASLSSYSIDAGTGLLTEIAAPLALPTDPVAIALDPQKRFAFVCLNQDSTVRTITLAPDGTPSVPVPPLTVIGNPTDLIVGPNGDYLYVSGEGTGELASYEIDQDTGELTLNQIVFVSGQPSSLALDPTGRFLVAADAVGGQLISIEVQDGAFMGPALVATAGGGPANLRFSADGSFLWVALRYANLVIPFELDAQTGALTAVPPGAGTGNLTEPVAIESHPSGRFAYAALYVGSGTGSVVAYTADEPTGELVEQQRLDIGLGPFDLLVEPTGSRVYVVNRDGDDLSVFGVGANGALSEKGVSLTGDEPVDFALTRRLQ